MTNDAALRKGWVNSGSWLKIKNHCTLAEQFLPPLGKREERRAAAADDIGESVWTPQYSALGMHFGISFFIKSTLTMFSVLSDSADHPLLGTPTKNSVGFDRQLLESMKLRHQDKKTKSLLSKNLARASDGSSTLLHYAAFYGNETIAQYLIELGSEVDALQKNTKETPLMLAVEQENAATVKVLLEADADIFITAANGKSALQMAFDPQYFNALIVEAFLRRLQNETSSVEKLVKRLLETACTLFHVAYLRDVEVIDCMLNRGFDVNSRCSWRKRTALHAATELNDLELTRWLVEMGADVNVLDEDRKSPLFMAVWHGEPELVQFLLDSGADPKIQDLAY